MCSKSSIATIIFMTLDIRNFKTYTLFDFDKERIYFFSFLLTIFFFPNLHILEIRLEAKLRDVSALMNLDCVCIPLELKIASTI